MTGRRKPQDQKSSRPLLAGVVGSPIGHSLSPLIHTSWAARECINAYYVPIEIPDNDDAFNRTINSLQVIGFQGVNVTLPHKERALRYADTANPLATEIGAANMLTFGGVTHAENSDVTGFADALRPLVKTQTNLRALVLGAGGAARAVSVALKRLAVDGAKSASITIANRTRTRAEAIAALVSGNVVAWDQRSAALEDVDMLVNTTSLGLNGQPQLDIDLARLPPHAIVADIVYSPLETGLLCMARARGNPTVDGLAMLIAQAIPGYKAWIGSTAEADAAMRKELVLELQRRGER